MGTSNSSPAFKIINGSKWAYLKRSTGRNVLCQEDAYDLFEKIEKKSRVDFQSLYVHKQLMGLSSNTGGFNNLINRFSAHKRKLKLEGGEVEYLIYDGDVLLTRLSIDWDHHKKKKAGMGLYTIRKGDRNSFSADPVKKITTIHAAVNGIAKNIEDATEFMPDFINYGYPESQLDSKALHTLFYNPYNGRIDADWKCMQDSSGIAGGTQAAKKLAAVIEIAAREKRAINWTIHERGCAIFKQALRLVNPSPQYDYSTQTVFYANSLVNVELIDQHRERLGMKLSAGGALVNGFSVHQGLVAGNWVSEPALIWKMGNKGKAMSVAGARGKKITGVATASLATKAVVLPALAGAAPWAMGLIALLGTNLFAQYSNRGIINNNG
ncbi:hypothetical protein MNBD_GAMMA10-1639, partial [hydrothermal vent metagenome]